jgi:hypothetical protein
MAANRVRDGYPRVSDSAGSGLGMVSHPQFLGSISGLVSGSVSGLVLHPWISEINHLELKPMFYNMLIITCLLRLLNIFKIDSWKYLLFIASYLYMWIFVYLSVGFGSLFGFRVSVRVSGIRRFGFGDEFPPESVFGSGSGFDFGFRFLVHGDSTWSEPDPLPSLLALAHKESNRICQRRAE